MRPTDELLLAALRAAPRRYRLPPLPPDLEAAAATTPETALAFAIEGARHAKLHRSAPAAGLRELFTRGLAALIRQALAGQDGDPAFQALVLRTRDPDVDEYVRLAQQAAADRRAVRAASDAFAHPGKLRAMAAGPLRDALARLHDFASTGAWAPFADELAQLAAWPGAGEPLAAAAQALLDSPALARLHRLDALLARARVQRYLDLCGQRGPAAGSDAAAAQGRAAARAGEAGEQLTVHAFTGIAALLGRHAGAPDGYRVLRGLRTPRGFPGNAEKAKEEWDAAIARADGGGPAGIVLLAEVKAAPAAATPDLPRLLRGLQRLAHAAGDRSYVFPCADGDVPVSGESLRQLQPQGRALPAHVVYCCSAPPEAQPALLSAASKSVLLTEPACLAFAGQLARGAHPHEAALAPVWDELATAPRLRSALHQDETSRAVREAMLHPDDLLAAVGAQVEPGASTLAAQAACSARGITVIAKSGQT